MASVQVGRDRFERGDFPRVCARTGESADRAVVVRARHTPGWVFVLLLFGILPFVIAWYFTTIRVDGIVPVSHSVIERIRVRRRFALVGLGVAIAGIVVAVAVDTPGLEIAVLVAAGLLLAAGSHLANLSGSVHGRPNERGQVLLTNAHRRFADTVRHASDSHI